MGFSKAPGPPTEDACQAAVADLILMVENQTASPRNPRRIVEMLHLAGPCDALWAGRPVGGRQDKYRAALGAELYEQLVAGAELTEGAPAAVSPAHLRHLGRAAARHFSADLNALYPLLADKRRARSATFADR